MNYISELKAFYDRLELNPLPSPAIALWHALMSIANKTGWQQEFTVAVSVLVLKSGLNAQAIKRARNRLEQDGFITWRSRGGNQSAIYHLNSLVVQNDAENVPQYEPQNVPQSVPQSVPQCEPQSVPINKHKQKQNKTDTPPVSPIRMFEDFFAAYPVKRRRHLAEKEYCDLILSQTVTEDMLVKAAQNYAEYCKGMENSRYIKNADNFLRECVFEDYLDENYVPEKRAQSAQKPKNGFHNFEQRDYDYDELMRQLDEGERRTWGKS